MVSRCSRCGALTEVVPTGRWTTDTTSGLWVPDKRMPPGTLLLGPPLCWQCRGEVIEGMPTP